MRTMDGRIGHKFSAHRIFFGFCRYSQLPGHICTLHIDITFNSTPNRPTIKCAFVQFVWWKFEDTDCNWMEWKKKKSSLLKVDLSFWFCSIRMKKKHRTLWWRSNKFRWQFQWDWGQRKNSKGIFHCLRYTFEANLYLIQFIYENNHRRMHAVTLQLNLIKNQFTHCFLRFTGAKWNRTMAKYISDSKSMELCCHSDNAIEMVPPNRNLCTEHGQWAWLNRNHAYFSEQIVSARKKNDEHEQAALKSLFLNYDPHRSRWMIFCFQFYNSSFMHVVCLNIAHL